MRYTDRSNTERIGVAAVDKLFHQLGYIFREQPISDTGIDAHIEIVHDNVVTGKLIAAQIKSGVSWFQETTEKGPSHFRGLRPEKEAPVGAVDRNRGSQVVSGKAKKKQPGEEEKTKYGCSSPSPNPN